MNPALAKSEPAPRFAFGDNWKQFLEVVDDERITEAERSLTQLLGDERLDGLRILDLGSGSGLFSLAASRLGAAEIHSIDYDPASVECTRTIRERFGQDTSSWKVEPGDATDTDAIGALGTFDLVYSWGVLHHTGQMWQAMENACAAVAAGGRLVISIYNDQGLRSRLWSIVKRTYGRLPDRLRPAYALAVMLPREFWFLTVSVLTLRPHEYLRSWTRYGSHRGMSRWHDMIDWVGGWPFEVARPEEVFEFCRNRGFELERLSTSGGGLGCNEFVFRRAPASRE